MPPHALALRQRANALHVRQQVGELDAPRDASRLALRRRGASDEGAVGLLLRLLDPADVLDRLDHDRRHAGPREIVRGPGGVLEDVVQHGCGELVRRRALAERGRNLDRVRELQDPAAIALRPMRLRGDRDRLVPLHERFLPDGVTASARLSSRCRATTRPRSPERGRRDGRAVLVGTRAGARERDDAVHADDETGRTSGDFGGCTDVLERAESACARTNFWSGNAGRARARARGLVELVARGRARARGRAHSPSRRSAAVAGVRPGRPRRPDRAAVRGPEPGDVRRPLARRPVERSPGRAPPGDGRPPRPRRTRGRAGPNGRRLRRAAGVGASACRPAVPAATCPRHGPHRPAERARRRRETARGRRPARSDRCLACPPFWSGAIAIRSSRPTTPRSSSAPCRTPGSS